MIKLYGHLREQFGPGFDIKVADPAEAIRALCNVVPGFAEAFRDSRIHLLVGDEPQSMESIRNPSGQLDISIVPAIEGGKSDGMQIILGAALIAASFIPGVAPWAASMMVGMGTSMVLGGIAMALASTPKVDDPDNGYFFSGPENTVVQGARVPIGYGTVLCGSKVVSAGTFPESYASGANGGPFGGNPGTWAKANGVWSNGGDGLTAPLCLGVDPA